MEKSIVFSKLSFAKPKKHSLDFMKCIAESSIKTHSIRQTMLKSLVLDFEKMILLKYVKMSQFLS